MSIFSKIWKQLWCKHNWLPLIKGRSYWCNKCALYRFYEDGDSWHRWGRDKKYWDDGAGKYHKADYLKEYADPFP